MPRVAVASENPVKLACVERGFGRTFPNERFEVSGVAVNSGVAAQPMTDAETLEGARNRTEAVRAARPEADFWVGIEGGADAEDGELCTFAWIVVTDGRRTGRARTGTFFEPPAVAKLIHQGIELGEADDLVFERRNSKQAEGAVGLLTKGVVDRAELYAQAVVLALIPFVNEEHYS